MVEVESGIFYAQGQISEFKFIPNRHSQIQFPRLSQNLLDYYKFVLTNGYPEEIFQDPQVLRCSNFRIKRLLPNGRKKISLELIQRGVIYQFLHEDTSDRLPDSIQNLPKMANLWFHIFEDDLGKNPGHEPILDKILRINQAALAIELPIWSTPQEAIIKGY